MGRILVTGGAGFISVNAVHNFARAGWQVAALDNLSTMGAASKPGWKDLSAPIFATIGMTTRNR